MQTSNSVTSVSAKGSAETDYDLASFTLSLRSEEASVPEAKASLKLKIDALNAALDASVLKNNVVLVANSKKTSFSVAENRVWVNSEPKLLGHLATFSLTFRTSTLDKVSDLYDDLTTLEDVTVNSPFFLLKDKDKLNKKALKDAFKKVTRRFAEECEVLGLEVDDFDIAAYEVEYHDTVRSSNTRLSMASMAHRGLESVGSSAQDSDPIKIESGKAEVSVNLEVAFKRKDRAVVSTK
jgi:uncharacterized protein YggE